MKTNIYIYIFQDILPQCHTVKELSDERKQKVISLSVILMIFHSNCYLTYTSAEHIKDYIKKKLPHNVGSQAMTKRPTRSSIEAFLFKKNCFICGKVCDIEPDEKHPDRWQKNMGFYIEQPTG